MATKTKLKTLRSIKRRRRVRGKINGSAAIPRMTVARSLKNIYVQIIDDEKQVTLIGLGTNSKAMVGKIEEKESKMDKAKKLGKEIAGLAKEKGIEKIVFDRNKFLYHGRIKALADGAREGGLKF
ncbi:MAG: 50S ribosomal protein L18 [candidate division Zixibacteria bacterium]|nr:50S ribosomal protein L18 [candidate division Zixibacteria bacterium]